MTDQLDASQDFEERLRQGILLGVHPIGTRLVEDRLCAQYNVKRHLLRAAFTRLADRGLVEKIPNRGVEVREPTPEDVDEIYDVRLVLETHAATLTPLPAPAIVLKKMEEVRARHEAAVEERDYRSIYLENVAFHECHLQLCPSQLLIKTIGHFAELAQMIRTIAYGNLLHLENVVHQHREILSALAGHDQMRYVNTISVHIPASTLEYRRVYQNRHSGYKSNGSGILFPSDANQMLNDKETLLPGKDQSA
jgi:DNA-binding GntR family transcriptional regulator